jgi:hypothetical protein
MRRDGSASVVAMSAPHVQCEWIVVLVIIGLRCAFHRRRYIGRSPYRFPGRGAHVVTSPARRAWAIASARPRTASLRYTLTVWCITVLGLTPSASAMP